MRSYPLILLLLLGLGACTKKAAPKVEEMHLPDIVSLFGMDQGEVKPISGMAYGDSLMHANRDLQASQLYVEAATQYHKAGAIPEMVNAINLAIDKGMANPKLLTRFAKQEQMVHTEAGQRLVKRLDSIQKALEQIDHYQLEMQSVEQFWPYFEKALRDTSHARKELKKFLLEGPPEIRDFYSVRYGNLDMMYGQMINASPEYYQHLKTHLQLDSLLAVQATTRSWMANFKQIYPQAVFPKVYIVPGILNSGGTTTEMGMFVGGDMYGKAPDMPTEGLSDWQKNAIMSFDQLPELTVHELMHFQQAYKDTVNVERVLGAIIGEGVCDFLVELSSGKVLENDNLKYLEDPENIAFIMADLKADLYNEDISKWLYNGGAIEDRPHDLGYTLGYLISKSYYENQTDKRQAVFELLNTDDFEKIYRESDYRFLLENDTIITP